MRSGFVAAVLALAACGDNLSPPPESLFDELQALPGVASVEAVPTFTSGYQYFVLQFEQPVDHDDPEGPTFLQRVSLLHRDATRPMIEVTSGYWDFYGDRLVELSFLLGANQVSIEHRFFGTSRPEPPDWSKLTIAQMAHDQHRITSALRGLYAGAFLTSGASKGGMTATYYRRFYPDDVDGTVPYVAPISFGAPDPRYAAFLDTLGPPACRQAVRDAATEMLANRRDAMLARATDEATQLGLSYTRIPLGPAVESAIFNLEWSFWQYYGVQRCSAIPAPTATDDELWEFLSDISPVSDNTDDRIAQFDAYYYQAYFQLGYPDGGAAYLDPYLVYTDEDYEGALPTELPTYDGGAAMADIDQFVQQGERFAFIYGEWDPWTAGQYDLGAASDSLRVTEVAGSHAARITRLADADRDAVLAKLEAWTGVRPVLPRARTRDVVPYVAPPRVPPAMTRVRSRLSRVRPSP